VAQAEVCKTLYAGSIPAAASSRCKYLRARSRAGGGTRGEPGAKISALNAWERRGDKVVASTAVVLAVALAAAGPAVAAPALPEAGRSPAVATIGTNAVGRTEQTFVDDSRPTKANGSFPGAPNRTLHTTIYYPALGKPGDTVTADATPDRKHGPYPMILFSHGSNSFGAEYGPLLRQWASAGYVVAAPDYPLSKENAPGGATVTDLDQQPADARFVIDRMLALSSKRSGKLGHAIDAKRVGASGHSLGALTTYRLVYETCCADKRVKAAAPMSGSAGDPPEFFTGISTPLLAEHGDADGTIPYQAGAATFAKASPPKFLLTLLGGGHTPPYRGGPAPTPNTVAHVTLDFFDRYLKTDRGALDRLRRDADQPGVATLQEQAG
jgi:dienelactone hydrolase